jgi:hemin uptake protein HemP
MSEPNQPCQGGPEARPRPEGEAVVVLDARQLFQGRREIVIEHEGTRYRLRITRRNKLILQK